MRRMTTAAAAVAIACGAIAACGAATAGDVGRPAAAPGGPARAGSVSAKFSRTGAAQPSYVPVERNAYSTCSSPQTYSVPLGAKIQTASASVAGFTNASKLNGSALLGEPSNAIVATNGAGGVSVIGKNAVRIGGDEYFCELATFQLDNNGVQRFPPARATFLAFGFMPVTATVNLTQTVPDTCTVVPVASGTTVLKRCPVAEVLYQDLGPTGTQHPPYTVVSTAHVSMRISDVAVNGVPLDVGPNCHADGPLYTPGSPADPAGNLLVLTGSQTRNILFGSVLDGTATIPPFLGCGTGGDNLDPLFDASISASANDLRMRVGDLCFASTPTSKPINCDPSGLGHPLPIIPDR
jgi:hypothetical protein